VRRPLAVLLLLTAAACPKKPELDPKEHVRGEHQRLLHAPADRVWPAVVAALDADGFEITSKDRKAGVITTGMTRYTTDDLSHRLGDIGDLSALHKEGITGIRDVRVGYYVLVTPAGEDTSLRIRSTIVGREGGAGDIITPGIGQIIPHRVEIPSRGVLERDLMRRLAGNLFTAEEMLQMLGEPGVD
jgi:hypothetical protein